MVLRMSMDIMIGARMLLRSCAMPPASVPMLSMRCARMNWASIFFFSVMSVLIASTDLGCPSLSRMSVQRASMVISRRSLVRCWSSPCHSPWLIVSPLTSSNFFGLA